MAKANEHGRLIAAAAKAALLPLGCERQGQSRFWYSDQRFWLVSIEFQPSGWSRGSYLNVGATWFWTKLDFITFDAGYRIADFIPFENVEQFRPRIEEMAQKAASEVMELRKRFRSLPDIHRWLITHATRDGWPIYHAAVAAGLVGDFAGARQLFDRIRHWQTETHPRMRGAAAELAGLIATPAQFRLAVLQMMARRRAALGLPPVENCLGSADSTVVRWPI
jgi:hypothetical protein